MTPGPRVAPLPPQKWSDEIRALMTADLGPASPLGVRRLGDLDLFTTLARHDRTFGSLMHLGRRLVIGAALAFDDRELVILRTAWNCQSDYEWGQHVQIAIAGGIDRATIDRIPQGSTAHGWSERETLLLSAADELHASARIADTTWAGLARLLEEPELIELPQLVGYYHLIAFSLGALAIQPEAGLERVPVEVSDSFNATGKTRGVAHGEQR